MFLSWGGFGVFGLILCLSAILVTEMGRFSDVIRSSALFTYFSRNPSYGFAACSHHNKIETVARMLLK